MTSTAQVQANRSNAQKSTGPRTAEGKAVAAQNAVRHGLLAKEVVVKGEDPGEFEFYRQQMLAELAPAGAMEEMLAQRIVGLSWRLRRAERLQATAYDKIETKSERPEPTMSPEDAGKLLAFLVKENMRCPAPASPPPGRRAVQDFNQERVLDRLLVYERRIEHSLYRTLAELRKLRKEGGIASSMGAGSQPRESAFGVPVAPMTGEDIHGQDARATHGRDAHATEPQGGTPNGDGDESCETNPICAGTSAGSTANEACETNPICPGVSSVKSEVSSILPTSNFPLETSDNPPEGGTPNETCQTKPIPETDSAPKKTSAEPPRPRMYPNTAKEMTYDFGLRRWVWTGYALANKDSNPADSGRRP